jgi:CheY-like chemotaxis protein
MPHILVVDGSPVVRTVVRYMLKPTGATVGEAAGGREALRLCAERPADLVVCDLLTPGGDGLGLVLELRRRFPGARVVATCAGGAVDAGGTLAVALLLGAEGALEKPFDREALLAAVAPLLPTDG